MEHELILYKPKKNIKRIIVAVLSTLLISFIVFISSTIISTFAFTKQKWKGTNYINVKNTGLPTNSFYDIY